MRKLDKKEILIIILLSGIITLGISNIVLFLGYPQQSPQRDPSTLIVAVPSGPATLELTDAWDSATNQVLDQVVETLFSHDLRDPELPRINLLAESYYWENTTTLHIKLREGVLFHDYTPFNATAVKWNLDRLNYLINATGANIGEVTHTQSLWMRPDGVTPIINNTVANGSYNITITLNGPYGPFLNLLTYINAGMISPTSHAGDETSFIDLITGDIVGTGPFIFNHFIPDVEVNLTRWTGYWRHISYFKSLIFKIYDDAIAARDDFINNQVDINRMTSYQDLAQYEVYPDVTVYRFTEETGIPSLIYQYIFFNNQKLNATWRKALSYAINYSYVLNELRSGYDVRAKSPISPGFGHPYNQSLIGVDDNITKARETMVSMGFGNMGWTDAQWIEVAESSSPFRDVYYPDTSNTFRYNLGSALYSWFKLIGVHLELYDPCQFYDPFYCLYDYLKDASLFVIGWAPDYLSPFNMLDPLFNPISSFNYAQVNDTVLNAMLELVLETTDDVARNELYKDIQGYIADVGYFHAPLYHSNVYYIHSADLKGFAYNSMAKFQAYGMWRE